MKNKTIKQKLTINKRVLFSTIMFVGISTIALAAETVTNQPLLNDTGVASALIALIVLQLFIITTIGDSIKNLAGNIDLWKKKEETKDESSSIKTVASVAMLLGFSLTSFSVFAAGEVTNEPLIVLSDTLFWVLISTNVALFGVMMYLLSTLKGMIKNLRGETDDIEDAKPFVDLTDAVPIEREAEIMMDHEYDGIRELDNNLPPWWVYMFYICIAFAVVYIVHYHISPIKIFENVAMIGPGVGQEKLYEIEMAEAQKAKEEYMAKMSNLVDESNVELLTDESAIGKGAEIFKMNCTPCHGQAGEGNTVGPNLTDEYWLNGGGIKNVFTTIKYGVAIKGMREWQSQFSPAQMQQVASYVLSLQGSNPVNPKDPQGEIWKEEVVEETTTEDSEVQTDSTVVVEGINTDEMQE